MSEIFGIIAAGLFGIVASSGFWAFVMKRTDKKSAQNRLLVGLAHDRILHLGNIYIERKSITMDEYENLHDYLYLPYKEMGGNGSAEKVMTEVKKLPVRKSNV